MLQSAFAMERKLPSLGDIVAASGIEKSLVNFVDAVTLDGDFQDFKKKLSLGASPSKEKPPKRSSLLIDDLTKIYCAIRAIKELSKEELWFKRKGGLSGRSSGYHDLYLLAHVMYGHFLSPLYGEPSTLAENAALGRTKFFEASCKAWRTDDISRINPVFVAFFVYEMSKVFQSIVSYGDVEIQDEGKGTFNVILYTNFQSEKKCTINIGDSVFSRTYSDYKVPLGNVIPDTKGVSNFRLKSITLMIDPSVISEKHENITSLPTMPAAASAVSILAPGIYQSKIFQPSYGLLQNLINFLNEFNVDPSSSGRRARGGSKKSGNSRGGSMASGVTSGSELSSELVVSTLWPEFAHFSEEPKIASEEGESSKEELHSPSAQIQPKVPLPPFRPFSVIEQEMGYVDTKQTLDWVIDGKPTKVRIIDVKHDGNCGYYALGLTREQAVQLLQRGLENEVSAIHIIHLIAREIEHRAVSKTLPDGMMTEIIRNILKNKDLIETRCIQMLSNAVKRYLSTNEKEIKAQNMEIDASWKSSGDKRHTILHENGEVYTHDELVHLVRTLKNRTKDINDLIIAHEKVAQINRQLIEYSNKKEIILQYINTFVAVRPEDFKKQNPLLLKEHEDENNWLDVNHQSGIGDALAYLMQSNLVILNGRLDDPVRKQGDVIREYKREGASKTIILILNGNLYMRGEIID